MSNPNTSIRELIFQNVKTIIQGIDGNPDYFYSIKAECVNIIHGGVAGAHLREPYVYIYPNSEISVLGKEEKGKTYKTLGIGIEAWVRSDDNLANMGTNINRIYHDIEKALMADPTRGAYAIDTRIISCDTFLESLDSPKCAVMVLIEIDYEHDYENPSSLTI